MCIYVQIQLVQPVQTVLTSYFWLLQLQNDLLEHQKQELKMKEDMEGLKGILSSEKKYLEEIICERDKLRNLCDEKDSSIQVIINKRMCSILTGVCILSLLIACRPHCWRNKTLRRSLRSWIIQGKSWLKQITRCVYVNFQYLFSHECVTVIYICSFYTWSNIVIVTLVDCVWFIFCTIIL